MTMKKLLYLLLPLSFVLSACPFESPVPLAARPAEPVDISLIGYWYGIITDGSDYFGIEALEIAKQSDSVYSITRYGKVVKDDTYLRDTSHFTGFISYLGEERFMNVEGSVIFVIPATKKQAESRKEKKFYYLASLERRKDTLSVKTIREGFSPSRRTLNIPDDLKRMVSESLGQKVDIYEEDFTLSYKKITKPIPLKPLGK